MVYRDSADDSELTQFRSRLDDGTSEAISRIFMVAPIVISVAASSTREIHIYNINNPASISGF